MIDGQKRRRVGVTSKWGTVPSSAQLGHSTASEVVLLPPAAGTWKCWGLQFPSSCLSATWRVENRMTFDSLLPSKFLPVLPIYRANEETGQETLEISFSGFQYTTLPSSEEKSLDGQETSCMLLMFSCIWALFSKGSGEINSKVHAVTLLITF